MVEQSVFRATIEFFNRLGVYDVILPFLLVFTIIFAILEKTKIFGTEKIGEKEYTRKNLNAITAFVMAFFVVASTRLVGIINETVANAVLLIVIGICFLLAFGTFYGETESIFSALGKSRILIGIVMGLSVVLIFLNAIKLPDGRSWLDVAMDWVIANFNSAAVGSIILVLLIFGFVAWITREGKPAEKK